MSNVKAREGQWYSHRVTRETFCVINVDEADGIIDVRDDHGDIDEFDFEEWELMDLELCAAPEGWDDAADDMADDDFGHPDADVPREPDVSRHSSQPSKH